jgi:phenylacetate-coenzyme A ligase PaaK-like adenylate-forming protein
MESRVFDPWRASAIALDVVAAQRWTREAVLQRQAHRLAALLGAAARRSPLYRQLLRGRAAGATPLHELPAMRKAELMDRFGEWVADPRLELPALRRFVADPANIGRPGPGGYTVWESSGSTGEPALFVQDAQAMAVYDALEAWRRPLQRWWNPWLLGERIAFVGATGGHFASTVSVERLRRSSPGLASALRGISFLQPAASLVAELDEFAPTILATYPTAALLLAEEAAAGRLRARPQEVWTGGEPITPAMRRFIAEQFRCPVTNSYGASEFLSLASECRLQRLHLNIDWVILESVDADGRPVPDGQTGCATLLTNLANHVQPLIRCDLGDRVAMHAQPCACGSPLPVIDVQGRIDDSLVLEDDGGRPVRLLPLALTTVLEEEAGVFDFQLARRGPRALALQVAGHGADGDRALQRARTALVSYLRAQGLARIELDARCGAAAVLGRSGKAPRVVSMGPGAKSPGI